MNYWDQHAQIQRLIESFKPFEDELARLRAVRGEILDMGSMLPARQLLAEFNKASTVLAHKQQKDMLEVEKAIRAALQPLFSLQKIALPQLDEAVLESAAQLNRAIDQARFIAELDFASVEEEEAEESEVGVWAEEQLIEVATPDVVESLRRVEFAPFTVIDKVLKNPAAMRSLSSRDFENFIACLVEQLGFEDVVLTPPSGDKGRDIIATKKVQGISVLFAFECKRYTPPRRVGPDTARALLGTILHGSSRAAKGVLVTSSSFTPAAKKFIVTEPSLDGKDFDDIVLWLREYAKSRS